VEYLTIVLNQSLSVLFICSGIPILASAAVGLVVAILQTATQVQEQSFVFLAKITAFVIVLIISHQFLWDNLLFFFKEMLRSISSLGHLV